MSPIGITGTSVLQGGEDVRQAPRNANDLRSNASTWPSGTASRLLMLLASYARE